MPEINSVYKFPTRDWHSSSSDSCRCVGWVDEGSHLVALQDDKEAAIALAESTVDKFLQALLPMFGNTGVDDKLNVEQAIQFRLVVDIVTTNSEELIYTKTLSRGARQFCADYWGKWINTFK
jgi:hypothetical protein